MNFLQAIAKSGVLAAFFINTALASPTPDTQAWMQAALAQQLPANPVWQALLHSQHQHANITDPTFLLSNDRFSTAAEMALTLEALYSQPGAVCRFPARYWWLKQKLALPDLPLDSCPDVQDFRSKAPMDTLSLIFVSETLTQPSSMMGHAFLKLSGQNAQGQALTHAVSFYTDADTFNLPKLLFDSLVTGKQGYFALTPYQEQQSRYTDEEERNVWEYDLKLDSWQRELVRLHLLELKQSDLRYFFQDYNCATVVRFIMALSGRLPEQGKGWVTPKDLVRVANEAGLIDEQRTITPSRWMTRNLGKQLSAGQLAANQAVLHSNSINPALFTPADEQHYMQLEHAAALNQYSYLQGQLTRSQWLQNDRQLANIRQQQFAGQQLSADARLDPAYAPDDSQISINWQQRNGQHGMLLSYLPVSHWLADDNRSYQRENGLQLLSPSLLIPQHGQRARLDSFVLYGMESLLPYDPTTGGLSGKFRLAYQPQYGKQLQLARATSAIAMGGLTRRLHDDIDLYLLAGGGPGMRSGQVYLQAQAEAGLILRGVFNSKTQLQHSWHRNELNSHEGYRQLAIRQSLYLNRQHTVWLGAQWRRQGDTTQHDTTLGYKYLF
jgi:hypothetical protein